MQSSGVALPLAVRDVSQSMNIRSTPGLLGTATGSKIAVASTEASEVARLKNELQRTRASLAKVKQELHQSAMIQQTNDLARASPPASTVESDLLIDENVVNHPATSVSPSSQGRYAESSFDDNDFHRAISHEALAPHNRDRGSRRSYEYSPAPSSSHQVWEPKSGDWSITNGMHTSGPRPSPSHYRRYGGFGGDARGDASGDLTVDFPGGLRGDFPGGVRGDSRGDFRSDFRGSARGDFRGDLVEHSRNVLAKNGPRLGDTGDFRRGSHNYRTAPLYGPPVDSWPAGSSTRLESPPSFSPPMTPMPFPPMSTMQALTTYHPRPIGTGLSPTALEFSASAMNNGVRSTVNPWNSSVSPSCRISARDKANIASATD